MRNFFETVRRWFFFIALVLGVVAWSCFFIPKLNEHSRNLGEAEGLQRDIDGLEDQLKVYRKKQDRFKTDPKFVEQMANEVGMVKPGEMIFKFD